MTALAGKRVLVLEDEWLIATEIGRALAGEGAVVVGPVADLATALAHAEEPIDAATLDVALDGAMSFPVADRLAERRVPYVFVTGYDGWTFPARHRAAPRITKPCSGAEVVEALGALVSGPPR